MALNLSALMEAAFGDKCFAFESIWMHSRSANAEESQTQDYVTPKPVSVRTCSASGTKFFDLDADGVRDASEPGIPRFLIWADYDITFPVPPGRYNVERVGGGRHRRGGLCLDGGLQDGDAPAERVA